METVLRILLLEDSVDDAALIERRLEKEGLSFELMVVETPEDFKQGLTESQPDVVISDHTLPQFNSQEALIMFQDYKRRLNPIAVFILVTGTVSEEFAVKIMKEGADDYILKDRLIRLPSAITSALEKNKLAEQKRKAEEEKLHLLEILQKSLNEIYIFDSDTLKFKYANVEALRNLGYSMEELSEISPLDLMEDASEDDFMQLLEKIDNNKRSKIFESYGIRKDKSRFPAQIHLQLIEEHAGKKTFLANVLDITEIKIQEQQKEIALYVQKIFNETPDLESSLKILLEGICRRHNLAGADIFAYNYENTSLKRYGSFSSVGSLPVKLGTFLSKKTIREEEIIFIQDLKSAIPESELSLDFITAKSFPLQLGNEFVAVINFYGKLQIPEKNFIHLGEGLRNQLANNIKRKRTESELVKIFEYSPDILSVVSLDGYFKKINPSFSKILGFSTEEILKTPFADLLHPDDISLIKEWEGKMKEDKVLHYETRYRTKSGDYKWIAWSVTSFLDENLSFAVGKDITDFKQNVEAIELRNKKLAEIAWEQSHVVRAPLARMLGCIHHLEESNDHSVELLQNIKLSAHELDDIIKSIVSRSELIKNI